MGLDSVELVMEVEKRFNVRIQDAVASRVRTVSDLVSVVIEHAPAAPTNPAARRLYEAAVLEEVRRIVAEQIGERIENVRPESRFVEDLNMG